MSDAVYFDDVDLVAVAMLNSLDDIAAGHWQRFAGFMKAPDFRGFWRLSQRHLIYGKSGWQSWIRPDGPGSDTMDPEEKHD